MLEEDSIAKALAGLDFSNKSGGELRVDQEELARAFQPFKELAIHAPATMFGLEKFSHDLVARPFFKELNLASSAISAFRDMPEFRGIQVDATRISEIAAGIGKDLALTLAPIRSAVAEMQLDFTTQLEANREILEGLTLGSERWLRDFKPIAVDIAGIAQTNFTIPESALLQWSSDVFADRTDLLKDCMLNTAALQGFFAAATLSETTVAADQLSVASQFVLDHAEVVRHLPPRLTVRGDDLEADGKKYRDEEIGAKLELALRNFDTRLLDLRRQAWRNLAAGNLSGARLGMAGIRELFTDLLHALAPDAEIEKTARWLARPKDISRPTRRMRLDYVLGDETASVADGILQFSESVNRTQKFVHAFADDVELVRIHMAHMESWIYLLLIRSRGCPGSN